MTRIIKKCYFLFIFVLCISFWALIKNIGLPDSAVDIGISYNHAPPSVSYKLIKIGDELSSQKSQSSNLLNIVRQKFLTNARNDFANEYDGKNDLLQSAVITRQDELVDAKRLRQELGLTVGLRKSTDPDSHGNPIRGDGAGNAERDIKALETDNSPETVIAVVVFVCNRPTVNRCLDSLLKYRPSSSKFPIIVSQDCGSHPATSDVLNTYSTRIKHIMQPDLSEISVPAKEEKLKGYYKIARHYGWALNHTFLTLNYSNVLVVEDDLEVAPDFFEYFSATLPILRNDPSLWCVSAWNDNGKAKRINESAPELLYRTDFFPGLGWMLTRNLWKELMIKWPKSYWDDWMREPNQRKDRACIRPEISRTSTFGKNGVSHGAYFQNHLRYIKLNLQFVPFLSMDLTYLSKDKYDVEFVRRVYSSQIVQSVKELVAVIEKGVPITAEFRLTYRTREGFALLAKKLEIMEDLRAGVPRTAYRGVVSFMFSGRRVYLAPGANWIGY